MSLLDRLHKKSPVGFAIAWIVVYVVGSSIADDISQDLGTRKLVTAFAQLAMSLLLCLWVRHAGEEERLGLREPRTSAARMLFYLPLLIVATKKVWLGLGMDGTPLEGACWVASMCCVGYLEELIFRGLLFRAMEPDGRTSAIVVSSLTFGMGHIVNVLNGSGQELVETLAQIAFAVAVGFMLVLVLLKSGSIWPCVIFHMLNNALSFFENEAATIAFFGTYSRALWLSVGTSAVVAVIYIAWLLRQPDVA